MPTRFIFVILNGVNSIYENIHTLTSSLSPNLPNDLPRTHSYFQGPLLPSQPNKGVCSDQRLLRGCVPENRLRVYDMVRVMELLADTDSVLHLRQGECEVL